MLRGSRQKDRSPPSNLKANYKPREQGGGMEAGLETAQLCTPGHWLHSTGQALHPRAFNTPVHGSFASGAEGI